MEHLNDSISAGERGWRGSRSSLMLLPKSRSPVHFRRAGRISPPKTPASPATPPPSQLAVVSQQATAPSVPTLVEVTADIEGTMQHDVDSYQGNQMIQ